AELKRRVEELLEALEEAKRAPRRQASPFSKHDERGTKPRPKKKPGRKNGKGKWATRKTPEPSEVTEVFEAKLPQGCPCCGEGVKQTKVM
ncbi:hypothetical protein DF186_16520, partial [Enterococcus hirae]